MKKKNYDLRQVNLLYFENKSTKVLIYCSKSPLGLISGRYIKEGKQEQTAKCIFALHKHKAGKYNNNLLRKKNI